LESGTGGGPLQEKLRAFVKPLLFLSAFAAFLAILWKLGLFRFFMDRERMIGFIRSLGAWGFAGFILIQAFQVVAAPIPGEATGVLGGYLYGPVLGVVLSTAGLTLGSYIAFTLSRIFGRPLTERFVDSRTMERFDYLLHHKGAFLVFLLFLIPGFPKDYLCYMLGLGHLSTLEFLAIASTGRLLGTTMLTLGGTFLRNRQYYQFFFLTGVAIVLVFLTIAYKDRLERFFRTLHKRYLRGPKRSGDGDPEK
jgi:uncharacterized membrane protein YdjX (TVP38/TMEM64 family)